MPLSGSSAVLILVAVVAAVSLSAIALSSAPSSESSMLSFLSLFPSSSTWPSPLQSSPPPLLIAFRAVGLSLVAATSLSSVRDPEGVTITARYLPASRLPKRSVVLRGFMRLTTFTVWCWLLVGLYFLAALLPPLAIVARTLFGVAFACSVLVTVVVTFILMPFHRAHRSAGNEHLTQWRSVVYHNLNSVLMGIEFAVGARTPELAGLPVAFLWGCAYVLFARAWFSRIGMYYYFFLDDSLPVWQVRCAMTEVSHRHERSVSRRESCVARVDGT